MAVTINIYSNSNSTSKAITFDFASEVLSSSADSGYSAEQKFFMKITTSAKTLSNTNFPTKLIYGLDDLALNGVKQSASNTSSDYATITALVNDYIYDMINGHTSDQFLSGVTERTGMKFT